MKKLTIGKKYNCEDVISKLKGPCPAVDDNTSREELDEWKKESPHKVPYRVPYFKS